MDGEGAGRLDRAMLSVVVPIYDERETLPELERRLAPAVEGLGFDDCEFLLVSDGSTRRLRGDHPSDRRPRPRAIAASS